MLALKKDGSYDTSSGKQQFGSHRHIQYHDYINFFLTFLGDNLPTYLSQIATARLHLYVDLYGSSLEY